MSITPRSYRTTDIWNNVTKYNDLTVAIVIAFAKFALHESPG